MDDVHHSLQRLGPRALAFEGLQVVFARYVGILQVPSSLVVQGEFINVTWRLRVVVEMLSHLSGQI